MRQRIRIPASADLAGEIRVPADMGGMLYLNVDLNNNRGSGASGLSTEGGAYHGCIEIQGAFPARAGGRPAQGPAVEHRERVGGGRPAGVATGGRAHHQDHSLDQGVADLRRLLVRGRRPVREDRRQGVTASSIRTIRRTPSSSTSSSRRRTRNGKVEYAFDFYILKPIDLTKGNHKVMYEPPNRGGKTHDALEPRRGRRRSRLGDRSRQRSPTRSCCRAATRWCGAAGTTRRARATANFNTTITLPVAKNAGRLVDHRAGLRVHRDRAAASYTLNYPAATLDQAKATLTHRVHLDDVPQVVPASGWAYNADGTAISLVGGNFVANDIYEFCVHGEGSDGERHRLRRRARLQRVPALRDDGRRRHARIRWPATSRASTPRSRRSPGGMLNDFRNLGFNQAENGKKVFDGMMQWIAAGDGINMNYRFSQPGRTERNRQDQLYAEGVLPVREPDARPIRSRARPPAATTRARRRTPVRWRWRSIRRTSTG